MIFETAIGKNFTRLHVSKAIVICHGFPYEKGSVIDKSYSDLAEFFSAISPTLIFDFSGCGNSRGYFGFKSWVADLKRISNKFRSVIIIGYSMGAMVAMKVADELQNLEKLVLISPPLPEIFSEERLKLMYDHAKNVMRMRSYEEFYEEMKGLKNDDFLKKLEGISQPKLVVHGNKDEVVPFECGLKIYKHMNEPKSFLKVVNGDHFLRRNQAVMQKVAEWIDGKIKDKEIEITI